MLPAFLSLLVCIVFEFDYFVEIVGAAFLFYILLDEIAESHLVHAKRIVRMENCFSTFIDCQQWVFTWWPSVVGIAGDEIRLLCHSHLLNVLHAFSVFLSHECNAFIGAFDVLKSFEKEIFLGECCKLELLFLSLALLLFSLPFLLLHALLVLVTAIVQFFLHLTLTLWVPSGVH